MTQEQIEAKAQSIVGNLRPMTEYPDYYHESEVMDGMEALAQWMQSQQKGSESTESGEVERLRKENVELRSALTGVVLCIENGLKPDVSALNSLISKIESDGN